MAARILVTGATGFIGGYLVDQLACKGNLDVTAIVRPGAIWERSDAGRLQLKLVPADLFNPYAATLPFAAYDALINLVGPRCSLESAQWEANVEYTRRLLLLLRRIEVGRVVHFSSIDVYGLREGPTPVTELSSPAPHTWYGITKALGEQILTDFHKETGTPVVILRPSWVVGYGSRLLDGYLIRAFRSGIRIVMRLGTPLNAVYVRDVADAAILAALGNKEGLRIYNINSIQRRSFEDFLKAIDHAIRRPKVPFIIPKIFVKVLSKRFDFFKLILSDAFFDAGCARHELGFLPQYEIEAMVKETLAMIESAGRARNPLQ